MVPERIRLFVKRNAVLRPVEADGVAFEQKGSMRFKPDGRWLSFSAEQTASVRDVTFYWHARVKMAPLLTAVVEDACTNGKGRLDVKMWGRLPVAHEEGPEIDRGEVQRYLAELPWNPAALTENNALRFADAPDGSTRVWVGDAATYVDLHFDEHGDIVRTFSETRHRGHEGVAPWEGIFSNYKTVGGARIPTTGEVAWYLGDERFVYWRGQVTRFEWT